MFAFSLAWHYHRECSDTLVQVSGANELRVPCVVHYYKDKQANAAVIKELCSALLERNVLESV